MHTADGFEFGLGGFLVGERRRALGKCIASPLRPCLNIAIVTFGILAFDLDYARRLAVSAQER